MISKQVIIFISFVIILIGGFSNVSGQIEKVELKDKHITIQMVNKPLATVFSRLIYKYDVAIGFEESILDAAHEDYEFETNVPMSRQEAQEFGEKGLFFPNVENHLITVDFKDARLEDVMDSIVKQMKNYAWEINNDVVNIFPIRGRNPKFEKLLDLRIPMFFILKGNRVANIQTYLYSLRELKPFLLENDLQLDNKRIDALLYIDNPLSEDIRFSNLTFRELLNGITKSKRGGWILQRSKDTKEKDKEFVEILI